jgi:transcriptional regulator with XRE-family HTH domain
MQLIDINQPLYPQLVELHKTLRQQSGLTQKQVANLAGVSTLTVLKFENKTRHYDDRPASLETIQKILDVYKL